MDKPLCRLCSKKHWKNEDCIFPDSKPTECRACKDKDKEIFRLENELGSFAKVKPTRADYMRAYMKRYRAKDK